MTIPERRPDRTLGPGHDTFWQHCGTSELHLPRCTSCSTLMWPIEPECPTCGAAQFAWERLSGKGTLLSWCTFEHDYYQGLFPIPWVTLLVELDEGPLFLSNPEGLATRDLNVGLPVEVAFRCCEDSVGPFRLPVFRAAQNLKENTVERMP